LLPDRVVFLLPTVTMTSNNKVVKVWELQPKSLRLVRRRVASLIHELPKEDSSTESPNFETGTKRPRAGAGTPKLLQEFYLPTTTPTKG